MQSLCQLLMKTNAKKDIIYYYNFILYIEISILWEKNT